MYSKMCGKIEKLSDWNRNWYGSRYVPCDYDSGDKKTKRQKDKKDKKDKKTNKKDKKDKKGKKREGKKIIIIINTKKDTTNETKRQGA